jgi:hypothetical protein
MFSTTIELAGFVCFIIAAAFLGGAPAALLVAGCSCLFVGASTDDSALSRNVRRTAAVPVARVALLSARVRARRDRAVVEKLIASEG